METKYTLAEAELILKKQTCRRLGHDYNIQVNQMMNMPTGIRCANCGDHWRVFHPVDPPTQVVSTIDPSTRVMPRIS